jgi:hypothetical protein
MTRTALLAVTMLALVCSAPLCAQEPTPQPFLAPPQLAEKVRSGVQFVHPLQQRRDASPTVT